MKNKKVLALAMVAALATAPVTTMAEEWQGPTGNGVNGDVTHTGDKAEYGHTTFSIIEALQNPNNVSFEVPLYVTMAVTDGETSLTVPTNYSITNTSAKLKTEGGVNELDAEDAFDIAVVKMDFSKLDGSDTSYNTVEAAASSNKDMVLTIGGVTMPALDAVGTASADIKASGSLLHNGTSYTKIPANGSTELALPITATLGANAAVTENKGAVAQFKVTYTVSALDSAGNLMGSVYAGDDKVLAGLDQ